MPVVPTTGYGTAEDAFALARSLVNDSAGVVFTDAVLLPFLNSAYRALQRELAENGVSVLVAQVDLDLPLTAGLTPTSISDSTTPQLPADLVAPHSLAEMATGSSDLFIPMEKITGGMPNFQPGPYLRMWEWIEDAINLVGATQPVTVRLRYEKMLPALVLGTDPVLIRNAADHGIETPEERLVKGKSARGTIRLDAYHQGNQVVIEVSDDGRGINHEKLMRKAIEAGIISPEEMKSMSHDEILKLIFHPGLTTAEEVTEISGRGVGMDVVKTVMDRLKGRVAVQSEPGRGTTFQLIAPLTLASIQALMFRVENQHYAVPLDSVIEISRIAENEVHRIDGHEVIRLREQVLSVVRLDQLMACAPATQKKRHFVVTIGAGSHRFGLIVDSLVGEEELVIKAFEDRLVATELVSGASILGDGTVVLILNVPAVVSQLTQRPQLEVAV